MSESKINARILDGIDHAQPLKFAQMCGNLREAVAILQVALEAEGSRYKLGSDGSERIALALERVDRLLDKNDKLAE